MQEAVSCYECGNTGSFFSPYLKKELCKKHLQKMIIRRIRSELSTRRIKSKLGYSLSNDGSLGYSMNKFMFRNVDASGLKINNYTLEDFATEMFEYFYLGTEPDIKIQTADGFSPLYLISLDEIRAFLGSKAIRIERHKENGHEFSLFFLKEIEKRRPGAMISLVRLGERIKVI